MKELIKKWWKLLVISGVILPICYWLFFTGNYRNDSVKISKVPAGLALRRIHSLTKTDSLPFSFDVCSMILKGDSFIIASFEPEFNLMSYSLSKRKERRLSLFNTADGATFINEGHGYNSFLFMRNSGDISKEARADIGVSTRSNNEFFRTDIPFSFAGQADDSNYYCVVKRAVHTYLVKYNFRLNRLVDSIDLGRVYSKKDEHLDFILQGKIILYGQTVFFKATYAGECLLLDKRDFRIQKKYRTIDSLTIPEFKKVEYPGGLTQYEVSPEIYSAFYIKKLNDGFAVLSGYVSNGYENFDNDNNAIDIYDMSMRYRHSYLVPRIKESIARVFEVDTVEKAFYVLYNDNRTIIKYIYND